MVLSKTNDSENDSDAITGIVPDVPLEPLEPLDPLDPSDPLVPDDPLDPLLPSEPDIPLEPLELNDDIGKLDKKTWYVIPSSTTIVVPVNEGLFNIGNSDIFGMFINSL